MLRRHCTILPMQPFPHVRLLNSAIVPAGLMPFPNPGCQHDLAPYDFDDFLKW
jgi:hypothetical protein